MQIQPTTIQNLRRNLNLSTKPFLIEGDFSLTKTQSNWGKALIYRDRTLEQETRTYIAEHIGSCHQALTRYQTATWPEHFACRSIAGIGGLASGENIFMFISPENNQALSDRSAFGLELVDVWENIFTNIVFPCVKKTFSFETQLDCATLLFPDLRRTIYLASLFHELGHRSGPFAVSPKPSDKLKINQFQLDVCGELYTDMLLIKNFPEFPELLYFVLMQRFFWFTRRDFKTNPLSTKINHDNDSWIGAYLWQKLRHSNALAFNDEKLSLNIKQCYKTIDEILIEIDELGSAVLALTIPIEQQNLIHTWMGLSCPKTSHHFTLPIDLLQAFVKCLDLPERPFVNSIVDLPISFSQI